MASLSSGTQTPKHPKLIELTEHLKAMTQVLARAKAAEQDELTGAAFWAAKDHPSLADEDEKTPARPRLLAKPDRFFL
jgi:hypothetical protein